MTLNTRLPIAAALLALTLSACSTPAPPADNGNVWDVKVAGSAPARTAPIATRAVRVGSEGATLPACPSVSRVKAEGTTAYWAPGETRLAKAQLPGGTDVALCEAAENDAWFGVVFVAGADAGADAINTCNVQRAVGNPQEYQGPCRWGWIRGGTVELGSRNMR